MRRLSSSFVHFIDPDVLPFVVDAEVVLSNSSGFGVWLSDTPVVIDSVFRI